MLIDWHANLWLDSHIRTGGEEFSDRVVPTSDASPERFERDVAGVVEQFVVVTMNFPNIGLEVPNAFVAEFVGRYAGRAKGFACVNPLADGADRALEHAVRELGLHGLKISPVYNNFDPWGPEAGRMYRLCDELDIPLLWHQSAGYPASCALEYGNPILLDRVAREFPGLRMIVAHLGQPWMEETVVLMRKHPQIFSDLSARFHRKWQLYNGLMVAHEYGVTDRILFGSDFPVRTPREALDEFRGLNDWGDGVSMPRFPDEVIEDIITNRPLELIWPDG
ncbi:MAG: amidohydrolase family protein [Pseudomonadota bacterium]